MTSISNNWSAKSDCLWTKEKLRIKQAQELAKYQESFKYDERCSAENLKIEEKKKCWCKINIEILKELKSKVRIFKESYPEFNDKMICFKTDEHSSTNISIKRFEPYFKRCQLI